jgi:hypothetical protein
MHACRLVYRESPPAPEMLWEWEAPSMQMLIEHARAFHYEVAWRDFRAWDDLAQENQRIWDTSYRPRARYQLWETWRAWLDEYRMIVRNVRDMAEEHNGRRLKDPFEARQNGHQG